MMDLKWACMFFMVCGIAHSEWLWQEDNPKNAGLYKGYKSLGCWMDKGWPSPRAMAYSGWNYDADQVEQCFGEAASRGYKYFAVEVGKECYLSNTDNYKRYGTSTGCDVNGAGGDWALAVYEVKGPGYRSTSLGCWSDTDVRAIKGGSQSNWNNAYQTCLATAIWKGMKYFAIQNQNECYVVDDESYKKYGKATGCKHGLGGDYKNDVYRVTPDNFSYKSLGCFSDRDEARAIEVDAIHFDRDEIEQCKQLAADRNNYYFALQNGHECRTFDDQPYNKYGTGTGCQHGTGAGWQNNVYKLLGE